MRHFPKQPETGDDTPSPIIEHHGARGRVVRFENPPGLYPVNRYQSLYLATHAEQEALASSRPLEDLHAWEPCCGGGPVAQTLKALGVGCVRASDSQEASLVGCRANAALNNHELDEVLPLDLLGPPEEAIWDLIAVNPPCLDRRLVGDDRGAAIRTAIDGGEGGVDATLRLIREAPARLSAEGVLLLVVVSTTDLCAVGNALDEAFPGAWRCAAGTPVMQVFRSRSSTDASALLQSADRPRPLVWESGGGELMRLSWVVRAGGKPTREASESGAFWLPPFGQVEPIAELEEAAAAQGGVQAYPWLGF